MIDAFKVVMGVRTAGERDNTIENKNKKARGENPPSEVAKGERRISPRRNNIENKNRKVPGEDPASG